MDAIASDAGHYNNIAVYTILSAVVVCIGVSVALSVTYVCGELPLPPSLLHVRMCAVKTVFITILAFLM